MASQAVEKIREAEEMAEQMLKNASAQAQDMVRKAREESEGYLQEQRRAVRRQAEEILAGGRSAAQEYSRSLEGEIRQKTARLKEEAGKNIPAAADAALKMLLDETTGV